MSIDELRQDAVAMTHWERHRFFIMIASVIGVSLFLVSIAMSLYNNSGAVQLDLSRPGYQDVRSQAKRDTTSVAFPSTGVLDQAAFDQFYSLYDQRTAKVTSVDSFGPTPLSEESLQLMSDHSLRDPVVSDAPQN